MKILITGFEPFGTFDKNPSWEAVKKIRNTDDTILIKKEIPVEYEKSTTMLLEILDAEKPDAVILTGVAGTRKDITVEKVAINLRDANLPDNIGVTLHDSFIDPAGKNAYFSTLPVNSIVSELNKNEIAASISYSAGAYVCNNLFYTLMNYMETHKNIIGGFIHLPEDYSDKMAHALEIAIDEVKKLG